MIYTVTLIPALDKTLTIDGFAAGKVNRVKAVRLDPGGKGINVSKTVKALGGESVAMGILGGDTGTYIERALKAMGIACRFVRSNAETRTNIKINDPIAGTTTDINEPGGIDAHEAAQLLECLLSSVHSGDIVALAGKMDTNAVDVPLWINEIQARGAKAFLDTEGEALKSGASAAPFLIKPNEYEFRYLTGAKDADIDDLIASARSYAASSGIEFIALSLGENGAALISGGKCLVAKALSVPVVSTVGAGDSMMAALCYAFDKGISFEDAARLAVASASAAVGCPGTLSPSREQINALINRIEIRRIT